MPNRVPMASPARAALRWGLLVGALLAAGAVAAGSFQIDEHTIDGGGEFSQGSRFAIEGSLGQPDTAAPQGGRFAIDGGFWRATSDDSLFQDGFED